MADLFTYGLPSSKRAFGSVGDTVSAGRPPGGVHVTPAAPATEREAELASRLDPRGAIHPRTSGLFWALALGGGFLVLNYRARR